MQFYVLKDTVDVVSEGLLVTEHGWTYTNSPENGPILSKPGRRRIKCHRESNVPMICTNTPIVSSDSTFVTDVPKAPVEHDHADFNEQVFDEAWGMWEESFTKKDMQPPCRKFERVQISA